MPPKKSSNANNKKAEKKVEKIVEDKTFGLKNKKKSAAVQKYIKGIENVTRQKVGLGVEDKSKKYAEKAEKKKARQEEAFLASLYKQITAVKTQEVPEGQQAKNILCENFKNGNCSLGDKCPFSHDLNINFNQGTFDIYTDLRNVKSKLNEEQEVNKIAEEKEKKKGRIPQSNIVCKYFLEAVKKKIYGWKWECPNGDTCHYRHSLPKGYILITEKDKAQEDMTIDEFMDLEEQIDEERARISENGTKVTEETFREWKKKRDEFRKGEKDEQENDNMKSKLTGVQLFKKQADLFKDDENAEDLKIDNEEDEKDNNENNNNINDEDTNINDGKEKKDKEIKINEELFNEEDNLDELDKIIDEEDDKKDDEKEEDKKDDEKEDDKEDDKKDDDKEDDKGEDKEDDKEDDKGDDNEDDNEEDEKE